MKVMSREDAVWLLTGTAYPGNAGYVIRTAEVSGADGVIIDSEFNRVDRRECVRFAMRADRFFPVFFSRAEQAIEAARGAGRPVIAIEDVGKSAPWQVELTDRPLFILGGESSGIPDAILDQADEIVRIPMKGFLPSYNLQAAMAVMIGERLRQLSIGESANCAKS